MKTLLIVRTAIHETNDQIIDQMRMMKAAHEGKQIGNVVCCIDGFDQDQRELFEIPEVRAFCRRLVGQGFISYLSLTTFYTVDQSLVGSGWGALEVWMCGEGRLKREVELDLELFDRLMTEFKPVWYGSNAVADSACGPMEN